MPKKQPEVAESEAPGIVTEVINNEVWALRSPFDPLVGVGFHPNIPDHLYHQIPYASNSRLTDMARCPAYCKERLTNPEPRTASLDFGTALHIRLLTSDASYRGRVGILPAGFEARSNENKAFKAEMQARFEVVLKHDDSLLVELLRESALKHPMVRGVLESPGTRTEVTEIWDDPLTGARVKGKLDIYHPNAEGEFDIMDVKTCTNAAPDYWQRHAHKYGYHRQARLYLDGAQAVTQTPHTRFIFIAIEKDAPYSVALYEFDDLSLQRAREELAALLYKWTACHKFDHWPAYGDGVNTLSLPRYAFYEEE